MSYGWGDEGDIAAAVTLPLSYLDPGPDPDPDPED